MKKRNISWEIILAGVAFIAVSVYLFNRTAPRQSGKSYPDVNEQAKTELPSTALPSTIVIDLENLSNLKNLNQLRNIKNLEELESLEVKLQNLDQLLEKHAQSIGEGNSVNQSLEQIREKLNQIDKADYKPNSVS